MYSAVVPSIGICGGGAETSTNADVRAGRAAA